ncbi:MAG: hypothetical protein N2512_07650 [Armatimonadetes bacterium]|nr:hypothetical protein [Armatimonadota bacterium]
MTGCLSLNGTWDLTYSEDNPDYYCGPRFEGRKMLAAEVPAPVHDALMAAGLLEDPNIGLNSLRARWVEEAFWIYRRTFEAPAEALDAAAWLVFERLEMNAVVWLNDEEIGRHQNAHRPARFNITGKLRPGENLLVVRVDSGIFASADKPGAEYNPNPRDLITKRHWHRKPQYQHGWDWNPRLVNVGILGDVRLEWATGPRLDQVTVLGIVAEDQRSAEIAARVTVENVTSAPVETVLRLRVPEAGIETSRSITLAVGESRHELSARIDNPRLWWPVNHGEQYLYQVEVALECGEDVQTADRALGLRRVEIDRSPHPVEGEYFILRVNNRPIFCKGGNWVPPDMFYSRVPAEKYEKLVDLALGANFNTLRIWGGACFAPQPLLEACDRKGVLIWHDFLFACSKYPGDDPAFAAEVRREVTWAVREMAHHPSLVVWCGNNEIEWGDWAWGYDDTYRTHPHYALFHHDLPQIVAAEDPSKEYWISSPFSPGYKHPNDPTVGDQHPWGVSIIDPGPADWWKYRTYVDRFPNEGGVLGCSSPATLRQFLPENERYLLSPSWDHHDNPLAMLGSSQGELGRAYQAVKLWTGLEPLSLGWEDYAFVSALLQAEGLSEYIANYRRRMFSSASAIFWMYNDSWPVTHGWTIVDYYLRYKLAYHPVRRAFQPVTVVVAEEDGRVKVFGVNDTPQPWAGAVRYGLFTLDGGLPMDETQPAELAANASTLLADFSRADWEALGLDNSGAFAVLLDAAGGLCAQHRLFLARFGELKLLEPQVELKVEGNFLKARSDVFAWGLCLDVDGEAALPDNCFDLLPGIEYTMPWPLEVSPRVVRVGNEIVHLRQRS